MLYYGHGGDQESDVTEITWNFYNNPAVSINFLYQNGNWGPIGLMTDERYKVDGDNFWLWQKPEGHCDVCDTFPDYYESVGGVESDSEPEVEPIVVEYEDPEPEVIFGGEGTLPPVISEPIVIEYEEPEMITGDYVSYSSSMIMSDPVMYDTGLMSSSYSVTSYTTSYSYSTSMIYSSYSMSSVPMTSYSYTSTTITSEPVTYSSSYTVTIDEDGNYIYPEGYESMDPADPTTWPGYDEDVIAGV